jgi:hypothetical protein
MTEICHGFNNIYSAKENKLYLPLYNWLRHYATSQKVASSNPDVVIGFLK